MQQNTDSSTWMIVATVVTAVATVVNSVAVVVLVMVTKRYAKSTARQADAAEAQSKSATAQANSALAQASAATQTVHALRQQMYDQELVSRTVVEASIKTALAYIEFWRQPGPRRSLESSIRSNFLPAQVILVPSDHLQAVECARRLGSRQFALQLGEAFDKLNVATQKVEAIRAVDRNWLRPEDPTNMANEVQAFLDDAREILQRCQTDLYSLPSPGSTEIRL